MTRIEQIAKVAHEVNRAYCAALGDDSQLPWDHAPEWARESVLNGVAHHIANPDSTPAASHENWLAEKRRNGWRWGAKKDAKKKEHPCFVPFAELPVEQQAKDHLFRAVVQQLLPIANGTGTEFVGVPYEGGG